MRETLLVGELAQKYADKTIEVHVTRENHMYRVLEPSQAVNADVKNWHVRGFRFDPFTQTLSIWTVE